MKALKMRPKQFLKSSGENKGLLNMSVFIECYTWDLGVTFYEFLNFPQSLNLEIKINEKFGNQIRSFPTPSFCICPIPKVKSSEMQISEYFDWLSNNLFSLNQNSKLMLAWFYDDKFSVTPRFPDLSTKTRI